MADQKYRVVKKLQSGGMAEVYIGEATSLQGFKKQVAIKRVLPHLAQNENFIGMFLDEARLSAKLNHANIVSVFDISAREDTYFLIMEYVDGANLKQIMEGLQRRGQRMRVGEAAYITIEACRGLSYAHELMSDEGEPLSIVHRDISPPNIMVTRRGEVKVADFGLAKAGTQLSTTDPGVVKGKFSYLCPEAAQGLEVDARADIFSLGIVLWEMLAGKRLFLGENDYATVKLIQKANVPRLSPLNREVDEEFEEVMLRALAADPKQRFQSAREFGDALAGYLYNRQLKITSYDIATLVTGATAEDVSQQPGSQAGGQAASQGSLIDRLIQEELDESVGLESDGDAEPTQDRASEPDAGALGDLEDPASWFSDDDLGSSGAPPAKPAEAAPPARDDETMSGSWQEAGLAADEEAELQAVGAGTSSAPPPIPESRPAPARAAEPPEVDVQEPEATAATSAAPAAPAEKSSGGGAKYVVIGLLLLGMAAAAAWFGTQP